MVRRYSSYARKWCASYLAFGSMFEQLSMAEYQEQADQGAEGAYTDGTGTRYLPV